MREHARQTTAEKTPHLPGTRAPGPGPIESLRLLRQLKKAPLQLMAELQRRYGDIAQLTVGPTHLFLLSHPDHVRHVLSDNHANYRKSSATAQLKVLLGDGLLTSHGETWRKHRKLTLPMFRTKNINAVLPILEEETDRLLAGWETLRMRGKPIEIVAECTSLAFQVASRGFFGTDSSAETASSGHSFTIALEEMVYRINSLIKIPRWIPTRRNRRMNRAIRNLDQMVITIVETRRRQRDKPQDLLQLLLDAKEEDTGLGLDDQQVLDEVKTFLFAGHETTANSLVWALYLLARHPLVQDKMREEIRRTMRSSAITDQELLDLDYTGWVVDEAMRVLPPAWRMIRSAIAQDSIAGYRIPAGSLLILPQFLIHRDPRFWDEPLAFQPERWDPQRAGKRLKFQFFPLGGGQRLCVANGFAQLEVRLMLARIIARYRLVPVQDQEVELLPLVTLRPKGEVLLNLHPI
jgi:cytochrome P450